MMMICRYIYWVCTKVPHFNFYILLKSDFYFWKDRFPRAYLDMIWFIWTWTRAVTRWSHRLQLDLHAILCHLDNYLLRNRVRTANGNNYRHNSCPGYQVLPTFNWLFPPISMNLRIFLSYFPKKAIWNFY